MNKETIYYARMFGHKRLGYTLSTKTLEMCDGKIKTYYYASFDQDTIEIGKEEYDCLLEELSDKSGVKSVRDVNVDANDSSFGLAVLKTTKEFALEFMKSELDRRVINGGCDILEDYLKWLKVLMENSDIRVSEVQGGYYLMKGHSMKGAKPVSKDVYELYLRIAKDYE